MSADRRSRGVNALTTLLSSAIGNFCTILATALLVRQFGAESFGRVALLSSTAIALATVTASGIGLYVVRNAATEAGGGSCLRTAWLWGQGLAGLLGFAVLVAALLEPGRVWQDHVMAAIAMQFINADALAKNSLIGHQRVLPLAQATLVGALLSVAMQLGGAWALGPSGYLLGFMLGAATQAGVSHWTARRELPMPPPSSWANAWRRVRDRELLHFVVPATLAASLVPLAHWGASVIAAGKTARYAEVAVLTVAMQFFNIVIFTPTVLNKIVLPHTIRRYQQPGQDSRAHTLHQTLWMLLLTAPAPLLCWLLGEQIASLYRFEDRTQAEVVVWFVLASVFACASIPISNYLVSHARMQLGLVTNLFWAAVYLGGTLWLPGGAIAVAHAVVLAYGANLVFAVLLVARRGGAP